MNDLSGCDVRTVSAQAQDMAQVAVVSSSESVGGLKATDDMVVCLENGSCTVKEVADTPQESSNDKAQATGNVKDGSDQAPLNKGVGNDDCDSALARSKEPVVIDGVTMDEERALYNSYNIIVRNCHFGGPVDGESALKESSNFVVENTTFAMRYVLWHDRNFALRNCVLQEETRAPLWYDHHGLIEDCKLLSVKNIRECLDIVLRRCEIDSEEFGWKSAAITLEDSTINSQYGFLDSHNLTLRNVKSTGKYFLQYVHDCLIENTTIETKDCLWHARNVTVKNSTISSEYLAWYSDGLTLINCKIISTQPLCYCKNLKIIDCTFEESDRAFEYSDIDATIKGHVPSIKNPCSGIIKVDSVGEIIRGDTAMDCNCEIIVNGQKA